MCSCGLAPEADVTWPFGSQQLSSFHAAFGPHVPLMCPGLASVASSSRTSGAVLLAVKQCSSERMQTPVQDGTSAHGLLYPTAVWVDWREQEHCQGTVDADPSLVSYRHGVGYRRSSGNSASLVTRSIGECRMLLWSAVVVSFYACGPAHSHADGSRSHYDHSISIFQPCRAASSTTSSSNSARSSSLSVVPSSQAVM
jgi:hypothetical protein